jgi:hypothetical protein
MSDDKSSTFSNELRQLQEALPRIALRLADAERTRTQRLELMRNGVRFRGLDELLRALDRIHDAWREDAHLKRLSFLVRRATSDFESAIEAALSGYPAAACEAMRDVMEIELLLLNFYIQPSLVDNWFNLPSRERRQQFKPVLLRKRIVQIGLADVVETGNVDMDYAAHSEALHVNPHESPLPFMQKGQTADGGYIGVDWPIIEMYEHGRRLGNALLLVSQALSPDSPAAKACHGPLTDFSLGLERTREFAAQFLAKYRAALQAALESIEEE